MLAAQPNLGDHESRGGILKTLVRIILDTHTPILSATATVLSAFPFEFPTVGLSLIGWSIACGFTRTQVEMKTAGGRAAMIFQMADKLKETKAESKKAR